MASQPAKYDGWCRQCGGRIRVGDAIVQGSHARSGKKTYIHAACPSRSTSTEIPEALQDKPYVPATPEDVIVKEPAVPAIPKPDNALGRMLAEAIEPYIQAKVDRDDVQAIVDEALAGKPQGLTADEVRTIAEAAAERVAPRVSIVEVRQPERDAVRIEGAHKDFARILQTVQAGRVNNRFSVWLYGDPGSGKSTIWEHVAEALSLPFYPLSLTDMTPASRVEGYGTADGRHVPTDVYKAYTEGGVLNISEIGNANGSLLTSLNSAIANGHGSFPIVGKVKRHPDFVLGVDDNTPGLGPTQAFPTRRKQDMAFRDRFVFLKVDYDLDLEQRLALAANPDCSAWIAKARELRQWCRENTPGIFVTPRSVVDGAALLGIGYTTREAAEASIFRGAEADIVNRASQAVGLGA